MPNEDGEIVVNNEEAEQESAAAVSTAEEKANSEGEEEDEYQAIIAEDGTVTRVKVEKQSSDDDAEDDDEEDDPANQPKKGADARKQQLNAEIEQRNEEIRSMVAERNRINQEYQQLQDELESIKNQKEEIRVPSVAEVMKLENPETQDFFSEFEAQAIVETLSLRKALAESHQELEKRKSDYERQEYSARVDQAVQGITSDASRALKEFPVFDEDSDEYIPELAERADKRMAGSLIKDNNGNVIDARESVYEIYKDLYELVKPGIEAGHYKKKTPPPVQVRSDMKGSGQRQADKKFSDLSIEEMEARLRKDGQMS